LWQRHASWFSCDFASDSGVLVVDRGEEAPILLLDARTGELRVQGPSDRPVKSRTLTPDGRYLLLGTTQKRNGQRQFWDDWLDLIRMPDLDWDESHHVVVETTMGRVLMRQKSGSAQLSTDGSTLLTDDPGTDPADHVLRIWDMSSTNARLCGVAAEFAFGSTCQLSRLGWCRWRRKRSSVPIQ
jgi:WD40 repeat protein